MRIQDNSGVDKMFDNHPISTAVFGILQKGQESKNLPTEHWNGNWDCIAILDVITHQL
jgi:hypothetical protein